MAMRSVRYPRSDKGLTVDEDFETLASHDKRLRERGRREEVISEWSRSAGHATEVYEVPGRRHYGILSRPEEGAASRLCTSDGGRVDDINVGVVSQFCGIRLDDLVVVCRSAVRRNIFLD